MIVIFMSLIEDCLELTEGSRALDKPEEGSKWAFRLFHLREKMGTGANFFFVLRVKLLKAWLRVEEDVWPARNQVNKLVIERAKSYRTSFRLSVLLAMLGTCVFFWGLAYKLSLYDTHQPPLHRIPEAKLLSKNEDPSATDTLRLCLTSALRAQSNVMIISAALMVLWSIGESLTVSSSARAALENHRILDRLFSGAHFFRPPPIHFVL